jgi:predicted kinase
MTYRPTFVMYVGLPGSGKSTEAKSFIENPENAEIFAYLSTDDIIEKFATQWGKTYDEVWAEHIAKAEALLQERLRFAVKDGVSILWDRTNLSVKSRRRVLSQIPASYDKVAVYFVIDEELRQQRLLQRPGKTIPKHVDEQMQRSFVIPTKEEGFDRIVTFCGPDNRWLVAV